MSNYTIIKDGFVRHAGPYSAYEAWMLDAVIAELRAGNIEFREVEERNGTYIYRSTKGYVFPARGREGQRRKQEAENK